MKPIFLLGAILTLALSSASARGQKLAASDDAYRLGTQIIRIPAPDGFIDTFPRYDQLSGRFIATEVPENEVLAVHVQRSMVPTFDKDQGIDLDFYTKVSVSKNAKTSDISSALFASIVSEVKKNFESMLDQDGPLMTATVKALGKTLNESAGEDVGFKLKEPKNLGFFDDQPNLISVMMLMKVEIRGKTIPVLGSATYLTTHKRLIFVYGFKRLETENDVATLREFTKKWTAAILAANK